jgi:hypothetical protein
MVSSPEYTVDRSLLSKNEGYKIISGVRDEYNLLCFNLHGGDRTHEWYGQVGSSIYSFKPRAFNRTVLNYGRVSPYVLCTEACFGARPNIGADGDDSMVVSALTNKCIAFVGSSRTAYGCPGVRGGQLSCADIIANSFTKYTAKGNTVGEAFLKALTDLCKGVMEEAEIKTLAEFALYGDPSLRLVSGGQKSHSSRLVNLPKAKKNKSLAISLMSCDNFGFVGKANKSAGASMISEYEKIQIKNMANNIRSLCNKALKNANLPIAGVEPKVYKVMGGKGYRAVYEGKKSSEIREVVKLSFDEKGAIERIYASK